MNSMQLTMWSQVLVYKHLTLVAYDPEQVCLPHCIYMSHCTTIVVYIYTPHTSNNNNKLQLLITMILPHMCQHQICPSNATYISQMKISSYAGLRQRCQYIGFIHSQCNQQCDYNYWYTYISHYWHMPLNKDACHTSYVCHTTFLLQSTYRPHITV